MLKKEVEKPVSDGVNVSFTDLKRFSLRAGQNHIRHDNEREVGFEALYQLQPGILLRILDLTLRSSNRVELSAPSDRVIFHLKLAGDNVIDVEGHESIDMPEGSLTVSYSNSPLHLTELTENGKKYQLVMLICELDALLQTPFENSVDQLPVCIQKVLEGKGYIASRFTMNTDLTLALKVLLNSTRPDQWNRAFIQAKTLEILCLSLRRVIDQESQDEREQLTAREAKVMEEVAQLLRQSWDSPPSQSKLVQIFGMGRSRLTRCFKLLHGYSITDYILNVRMQHAQQLLAEGRLNVTQVAMEVGYEHSSNFTSMFKSQFGISPKAFQQATVRGRVR